MNKMELTDTCKWSIPRSWGRLSVSVGLLTLLTACAVGPTYETPEVPVGTEFQQLSTASGQEGWRPSQPKTVQKDWWQVFGDPQLAPWLEELLQRNASLEQAEARYRAAQAALEGARSSFWPQLGTQAGMQRRGEGRMSPTKQYNLSANVSWELDVWGRVRRQVEGSEAQLQASAADLEGVKLSLISTFLQTYFQYQLNMELLELYAQTIDIY